MATISAPNAALFDSDPLEQIFAKGTLMPNMAGLANLMMFAERQRSDAGRSQYLGALEQTQALEQMMGSRKIAADLQKSRMDNTRHLAEKGYMPGSMYGGADLFSDIGSGDAFAKLMQEEIRSKIFSNMNKGGGGAGGKPTTTVQVQQPGFDMPGMTTITSKNADPNAAFEASQIALAKIKEGMRNGTIQATDRQKAMMINLMMQHGNQRNPGIVD